MQRSILDTVAHHLPLAGTVLAPGTAGDLPVDGPRLIDGHPARVAAGSCAGIALLDEQLSRSGEHAEALIEAIGTALEPLGVLAATVHNRVFAAATGTDLTATRGYSAAELTAMLNHRGLSVTLLCAPGAAARLRGEDGFDLDADRQPGLLDAGPRLLAVARAPRDEHERSDVFLTSRPRKIVSAATICRDGDGRMLVVYDRFRRLWTLPGGLVDADEDPASAARRETWEEGGHKVETGRLLGVFSGRWPDRVVFVFAAEPAAVVEHPEPLHEHEIAAIAWLPVAEALGRLDPTMAARVQRCLQEPGHAWVE